MIKHKFDCFGLDSFGVIVRVRVVVMVVDSFGVIVRVRVGIRVYEEP